MPDTAPILINRTAIGAYRTPATGGTARRLGAAYKHWLAANATELKLTVLIVAGVALAGLLT